MFTELKGKRLAIVWTMLLLRNKSSTFSHLFFFLFCFCPESWCQKIRVSGHPCWPFSCRELFKSRRTKPYHLCSETQMLFMLLKCFTAVYLGVL